MEHVHNTQHFRDLLVQRRGHVARQINDLASDVARPNGIDTYPESPADQLDLGAEAADNNRVLATAALEQRQLEAIDAALARIERGDYGICESCGSEIASQRLEVVPEATMCMDCKKAAEQMSVARKKGP